MGNTIDMQGMRYLNLFSKITKVTTRHFFKYNETLMFCVPRPLLSRALGRNGENLRKMGEILKKRIRILAMPNGIEDAEQFVRSIISPVEFKEFENKEDQIVITAGSNNKAALLGRNKRRLNEMREIINDFFKKEVKII